MGHLVLATRPGPPPAELDQHAALSAYLLGLWGIPHAVLEAVAFHEQPARVEHDTLEVMDVVHLCDAIVSQRSPSPFQPPPVLDVARFERLGVGAARLAELSAQAQQALREAEEMLSP
jgi:HD-like signal output (HDOD) protein